MTLKITGESQLEQTVEKSSSRPAHDQADSGTSPVAGQQVSDDELQEEELTEECELLIDDSDEEGETQLLQLDELCELLTEQQLELEQDMELELEELRSFPYTPENTSKSLVSDNAKVLTPPSITFLDFPTLALTNGSDESQDA